MKHNLGQLDIFHSYFSFVDLYSVKIKTGLTSIGCFGKVHLFVYLIYFVTSCQGADHSVQDSLQEGKCCVSRSDNAKLKA